MWNCEQVEEALSLAVGSDLPSAGMIEAQRHLTGCEGCRGEMRRYEEARSALLRAAEEIRAMAAEVSLWKGLESRLDSPSSVAGPAIPFAVRRFRLREWAAAAAVFLVGAGAGWWVAFRPASLDPPFSVNAPDRLAAVPPRREAPYAIPSFGAHALPANYSLRNLSAEGLRSVIPGGLHAVEVPDPKAPEFRIDQARPVEETEVEFGF